VTTSLASKAKDSFKSSDIDPILIKYNTSITNFGAVSFHLDGNRFTSSTKG